MVLEASTLVALLALLVSAAGAVASYGAKSQQVRDLKERVDKIEARVEAHGSRVSGIEIAFAKVETLLNTVVSRLEQLHEDIKTV